MNDFFKPIIRLHQRGYSPKGFLDIGAHHGMFSGNIHQVWPKANKLMFEANPAMGAKLARLNLPYRICLLGSKNAEVDFYIDKNNEESTGNSIFVEQSDFFKDPNIVKLPMFRLDDVLEDTTAYDFMKLDVQGAELEVLAGAPKTLKSVRYIFLEVSLYECNRNAPLFYEVHSYIHGLGYRMIDLSELTIIENKLLQLNVLFERVSQ